MEGPPPERTIVHVLRGNARRFPDRPWIVTPMAAYTYGELDRLSDRVANGLAAAGLSPGDRLLAMLPDSIELVAVWLACAKLGVVEVPVNTAYRGDVLAHVVNDSGATIAIVADAWLDRFAAVEALCPKLKTLLVLPTGVAGPLAAGGLRLSPFEALLAAGADPVERMPRERDHKAIMYTSGTTGNSKGVMVSHAHAHEYAAGCAAAVELDETDVFYSAGLPLFHVAGRWGVLYGAAIHGATAIVPKQFSAGEFWADTRRHGVTATYLLGAMASLLQRRPPQPDDAENPLRKVLMCPLLPDVEAFAERFDLKVSTAYGSTEANAPLAMPLGARVDNKQVVGRPRADKFEVAILDEDDRPVPPGASGEIAVRPLEPWLVMLGYWNNPEATARMWRNLWLHTGDAGFCDADGNFHFTDRLKDSIRRRGENISSMELEGIIGRHPAVLECAVFPIASEFTEQEVAVAIVLRPGEAFDPVKFVRFLEPRVPYFMVPRYVDVRAELPKTQTGKVRKHVLRAEGLSPGAWDREAAGVKVAR